MRFVNASHRQTLGYEPDALIGTDVMSLVHPDDRDIVVNAMAEGLLSQTRHHMVEYRCKRTDGVYVWVETVGDVLRDPAYAGPEDGVRGPPGRGRGPRF